MDGEAKRRPLPQIRPGLPSRWYYDPAQYERELEAFWYRSWLCVGRADSVEKDRDYRVVGVGDQSVLVTRDAGGRLRAFHNTCRHRGSELCSEREGRFRGPAIVCPYHGWTYSLEGELVGTPHQVPSHDFDRRRFPLYRVAVDEWAGCLFVNLAGEDAPPLEGALGSIPGDLAPWRIGELAVAHRETRTIRCNWKIFWENFSECFHCPGVHPELCRIVPVFGKGLVGGWQADPAGPGERSRGASRLAPGAVTWSLDGRTTLPPLPGLTEAERNAGQTFGELLPGFFAVAHVDHVRIAWLLPRGPESIEITFEWLLPPEALARGDLDLERVTALGRLLLEQDARVCELNQRGLRSRRHEQGVLVPQEAGLAALHDWLRRGLGEPA